MSEKKAISIVEQNQIHWIDHLAVIAIMMDIPLISFIPSDHHCCTKYYPGLKSAIMDFKYYTALFSHFDVFFTSWLANRNEIHKTYGPLEEKYKKKFDWVHVPHGFSDKGYDLKLCADEEILLIYGQNMLDLLKHEKVQQNLHKYVITGNYRYTYYKQNKEFYDKIINEEILSRFDKIRPIILYAPTWMDDENASSFYEACGILIDNLPSEYNLIVKTHPRLKLRNPDLFDLFISKYNKKPYVVFLEQYPLVFPVLDCASIYIGDVSSVGYDFLAFNKPMYFLNKRLLDPAEDRRLFLYRCGIEITPDRYQDIFRIIEQTLPHDAQRFGEIRKQIYDYSFGPERPFAEIKADILKTYS